MSLSEKQKETAKECLEYILGKNPKYSDLKKEVEAKKEKIVTGETIVDWNRDYERKNPKKPKVGVAPKFFNQHKGILESIVNNTSFEVHNASVRAEYLRVNDSYSDAIERAKNFCDRVKLYLGPDEKPDDINTTATETEQSSQVLEIRQDIRKSYDLNGVRYYAYFLYYDENKKTFREAILGRAVITIDKNSKVHFENTRLPETINYNGYYESYLGEPSGLVIFNLSSGNGPRNLHIKAHCKRRQQNIIIASYLTYELGRIQAGNMVLQRIPNKAVDVYPDFYTIEKDLNDFDETNVPPQIVQFLRLKHKNYFRTYRGIYKLKDIPTILSRENEIHEDERIERFLEVGKMEIYLSFPMMRAKKDDVAFFKMVKKDIEDNTNYSVEMHYEKNNHWRDSATRVLEPKDDLMSLKTKRFFILFLEDVVELSYCFLQMGWCLAHSKHVILIAKVGTVSKTIQKMSKSSFFHLVIYKGNLKSLWDSSEDSELNGENLYDNVLSIIDHYTLNS